MEHKNDFESAFNAGKETKIITTEIAGITHVQTPPGSNFFNLEKLMPAPLRIKAHPKFSDIEGFAEYIEEFKEDGSRIFVDEKNLSFTTTFDFHAKGKPAWGEHAATLQLVRAHEWGNFKALDGKPMKPIEFAEFIEDNLAFISAEDKSAADLLTMAQTFKINVKGEVTTEEKLHNGLKKLVIIDESTVKAANTKGAEVSFPEKFDLKVRFFKNSETYPIQVFLRYRASSAGIVFFIKIPDPIGLEEEAFNSVLERVKEATGLPTLKGAFN